MIDFSTIQSLVIEEGVVTKVEDDAGNVLWTVQVDDGKPIVLEVAKQTLTTYAGETGYADESFILLDIYPKKSDSVVNITYGNLQKTLAFSGTNAQQVYFGTFNGVADEVETPASGTLTIEGGCGSFACGVYQSGSKTTNKGYCPCISAVREWGSVGYIAPYAFYSCVTLALTSLPDRITSIGTYAFYNCAGITFASLPDKITSLGAHSFDGCTGITIHELPQKITSIPAYTFQHCKGITSMVIHEGITSIGDNAFAFCENLVSIAFAEGLTSIGVSAFTMNIEYDSYYGSITRYSALYGHEIVLPSTIQTIGASAFAFSTIVGGASIVEALLNGVTILATVPPTITGSGTDGSFGGYMYKVAVPVGCADAYKAADGWSYYADRIVEVSA